MTDRAPRVPGVNVPKEDRRPSTLNPSSNRVQIGDQVRFANDPVVLTVFEVTTDSNGTYIRTQNLEKKMRSDGWITGPMARQYEIVGRAIPNRVCKYDDPICPGGEECEVVSEIQEAIVRPESIRTPKPGRAAPPKDATRNRVTKHGGSCCCPKCDPETYSYATRNRVPEPCNCWGMTPWGTWERKTSAPCVHGIET